MLSMRETSFFLKYQISKSNLFSMKSNLILSWNMFSIPIFSPFKNDLEILLWLDMISHPIEDNILQNVYIAKTCS